MNCGASLIFVADAMSAILSAAEVSGFGIGTAAGVALFIWRRRDGGVGRRVRGGRHVGCGGRGGRHVGRHVRRGGRIGRHRSIRGSGLDVETVARTPVVINGVSAAVASGLDKDVIGGAGMRVGDVIARA